MRARNVAWMGLLWALAVLGFQLLVSARYAPERPDRVLTWTADETGAHSHDQQPYLLEPFMRQFVAWDSEFYLSIAIHGYDDPAVRSVDVASRQLSLNYAFFPFYPAVVRVVARPLSILTNRIAAATLAGVIVSVLGAIGAAMSLFLLVRADRLAGGAVKPAPPGPPLAPGQAPPPAPSDDLAGGAMKPAPPGPPLAPGQAHPPAPSDDLAGGAMKPAPPGPPLAPGQAHPPAPSLAIPGDQDDRRAWKTAFFFLIFPTSFFLAQVYTEGLFTGLAFGSIALAYRRQIGWAAFLAVLATWTRAVGVFLVIPVAWACWEEHRARGGDRAALAAVLFALAPVAAFLLWWLSPLGRNFGEVEREFFGRGAFHLRDSAASWGHALAQLRTGRPEARVYYGIELSATAGAIAACLLTLRRMPGVSLFGLAALLIPLTSGEAQGFDRFVLAVPSLFVVLGGMGERSEVLDRAWTVVSVLLLGMLASLFTFDFWVA